MTTIFAALATLYSSAAQAAAALGISRQAYSQAIKRRRLSDSAAIRAAALLNIDPGNALFCNATSQDIAAPIIHPTDNPSPQIQDAKNPPKKQADSSEAIQIIRGSTCQKKSTTHAKSLTTVIKNAPIIMRVRNFVAHHLPLKKDRQYALDCAKWMLCVPRISPDSPRFVQYFSRWCVPEKIESAKQTGKFDEITKDCPPIAPELLNYIQAGIDEYLRYIDTLPSASIPALNIHKTDANKLPSAPTDVKLLNVAA